MDDQSAKLQIKPKNWIIRHKKPLIIVAVVLVLALITGAVFLIISQKSAEDQPTTPEPTSPSGEEKPAPIYYSRLSGQIVDSKEAETAATTCVMIENSPSARPQSGLSKAGIVYEAIAEGGITRFLAIFQDQKPDLVGPVRSVRMYYVDWLTPYNCSVAHVGGADDALAALRNSSNGYRDIDQFFSAGSYWRSRDRYAPHNMYTNFERLDALNASRGYSQSVFDGFPRLKPGKVPAENGNTANSININISSALYNSSYSYDSASNSYLRSHQSGGAHLDRDVSGNSVQNAPKVVIAMMVSQSVAWDGLHQNISTINTGKAHIFQNGQAITGTWSKNAKSSEIKFTDANGKEIKFLTGQIWITAVPNGKSVSWQ